MAQQDFDTYTEVDPNGDISIVDTLITVTTLARDVSAYVYKDFGVDYFEGDIQVHFKLHIPSGYDASSGIMVAVFSNDLGDWKTLADGGKDALGVSIYNDAGILKLFVGEMVAGSVTWSAGEDITALDDTDLYVLVMRDEHTDAANGSLRCWIFNDDEWTATHNAYEALSLTDKENFRYFFPVVSVNNGTAADMDLTVDEVYVGNSTDDVTYSSTVIHSPDSVDKLYVRGTQATFAKTSSGRWYGNLRYITGGDRYVWWVYSDDDGSTWSGPYLFGGPTSWIPNGATCVAMGSWDYDDVLLLLDYKDNTTFSYKAVEGMGATGAFAPGSLTSIDTITSGVVHPNLININQTDETFIFWPQFDSGNFGWEVAYTDHEGDAGWTASGFNQESSGFGNSLDASGGIRAIATRDGLWIHLLHRSYSGSVNFDTLRIRRYDVTNHTFGSSQVLVLNHGEVAFQYIQATIDMNGYIHVVWGEGDSDEKVMYMRFSDDGDDTYTVEHGPSVVYTVSGENFEPGGISINEDGEIYVIATRKDELAIHMMRSQDNGETWGTIKRLTGTNLTARGPYQDSNRSHTYLDSGSPPFMYIDEDDDDFLWMTASDQGDYLKRWPDESPEDMGDWGRRVALTIDSSLISEDLTHFPLIVHKDILPGEMFLLSGEYAAQENGYDIRVSLDESGEQRIPVDVREFHIAADTGDAYANICVSITGDLTTGEDTTIYVWYNNPTATVVHKGEVYGGANVYNDDFKAVFPLHEVADGSFDFNDRTRNGKNLVSENMDATDRVAGVISYSQETDGVNETLAAYVNDGIYTNGWFIFSYPFTCAAILRRDPAGIATQSRITQTRDDSWDEWWGMYIVAAGTLVGIVDKSAGQNATTGNTLNPNEKGWCTFACASAVSKAVQLNDGTRVVNTVSEAFPSSDPVDNFFHLGRLLRSGDGYDPGVFEEVRLSTVARSSGWSDTEYYNIFDPLNFWTPGTPESPGPVDPGSALRRHMCLFMST